MNHNIAQSLPDIAKAYPDKTGLICKTADGYRSWTFDEMDKTSDWFGHRLSELGIARGNRVMLMVKPSVEFITLTFALFKIGAVIILIDPGMGYRNLRRCIGQVQPEVLIGIPKALLFKLISPQPFRSVRTTICIGSSWGIFKNTMTAATAARSPTYGTPFGAAAMAPDDPAAILFTTGSTGPPKGVCYEHSIFQAQLKLIREHYRIGPGDIDQPAFPLFALFSTALGACSVIPEMNPAKPAQVDPVKFINTIQAHNVTYSFGSPAIWNIVSQYCLENRIILKSVQKILMAGAPVPGELLQRTLNILSPGAEIHTPYGATESLPITSIAAKEILAETWEQTKAGSGVCVGRVMPDHRLAIIKISDEPIENWHESLQLPVGEIGEILVKGPVVTRSYDNNNKENRLAKIADDRGIWHRMGDLGYLDEDSRLWFCGRKAHRVVSKKGSLYSVCCEAIFNEHPQVFRSALVGVGPKDEQMPVILVELHDRKIQQESLLADLRELARRNELTSSIEHFLIHPDFPVDIRHNAKIFREVLAQWAKDKLLK